DFYCQVWDIRHRPVF
nr:immunoglobulin light chain junction region [Macaca mulatta]MOW66988.1 immunoglobulin light chain junction region [Macaca mulatta]MOW67100.1 immunoglobulin light chain junction region [Macaca mulatta]MOW67446.1 immunoglobulin light chain junction region [Macaca mulatta]MOW67559.1 immunoglobulin light chain junction region [Macaca mulatta]